MKTVDPITDDAVKKTLRDAVRYGPYPYLRERAQAVLLSSRRYSMQQIADILEVHYQTVNHWIDDYGICGLYKGYDGGKPPIYSQQEEQKIKNLVAEEPRRLSYVQAKMEESKHSSNDRYTIVMVDNASIHTSHKFKEKIADWMIEKKLIVCYLPTYSPELNLIEILWKKMKYEWLNLLSIMNFKEFEH
ncbi:transposase [Endozoicomonas acroporae]|uniref:transposase n=1 Tax=Endozoicomonas acroporae TaxID=1701104 RepID=UPI000C76D16F|nr:transposase [Endozoicomonas acroporae]